MSVLRDRRLFEDLNLGLNKRSVDKTIVWTKASANRDKHQVGRFVGWGGVGWVAGQRSRTEENRDTNVWRKGLEYAVK